MSDSRPKLWSLNRPRWVNRVEPERYTCPDFLAKEREIEMGKEDLQGKPENIRAQIVEGRMAKLVKEKALPKLRKHKSF